METASLEMPVQVMYLDEQILVVCTGPCGEAFLFVEKPEVEELIRRSVALHRQIDRLIRHQTQTNDVEPDKQKLTASQFRSKQKRLAHDMRTLGEYLFMLFFRERILDLFNVTIGQAIRSHTNVVIRLMIVNDFLNIIPWELLCDRGTFLCHTYDLLRHPFAIQPVKRPFSLSPSVRVLFVGSNPRKDIYVRDQLTTVQESISSLNTKPVCIVSPFANYSNIAREIYQGTDILHFLAHGEYTRNGDKPQGYFLIDGEKEESEAKLPVEMLQTFCRASPMQLAILSACRSDQGFLYNSRSIAKLEQARYYSMAHALIQIGVPCVIGMSHPISKIGSGILVHRIYHVLVNQQAETITKAVRQARLELFARADDLLPSDWMTPVLYSRVTVPAIQYSQTGGQPTDGQL